MPENSRRSAHASIRGYLYQTCLGVLRWLHLQPNEVLICEGDEDLDRYLLDGTVVCEQVKAYSGRLGLGDRAILDSLTSFLCTYVALRRVNEDRKFIFTTTAEPRQQRKTGLDFDLLEKWRDGTRTPEVIEAVRSLLKTEEDGPRRDEILAARIWLDGQPEEWLGFMNAVEWTFGAPDLETMCHKIKDRLAVLDETQLLPAETFLERLVTHVFQTSSRPEPAERILTRKSLSDLIDAARTDLGHWAATPRAARIRTIFNEGDRVNRLLQDGISLLPPNAPPGKLLTAAYEVIPFDFDGRSEELGFLADWCHGDAHRSVLLLRGEGGSGKTRLMIEWCRHLRHQGWHAGFLRRDRSGGELEPLLEGSVPRLVVVDYAEARLEVLQPLLYKIGVMPEGEGPRIRLILLARRETDWWSGLSRKDREIGDILGSAYVVRRKITSLVSTNLDDRKRTLRSAVEGFSRHLRQVPPEDLSITDLQRKEFERILYLHMAALAAVLNERIETLDGALEETLEHERRYWHRHVFSEIADRSLAFQIEDTLDLAVAALTLVGGAEDEIRARSLLERALKPCCLLPHHSGTILRLLRNLYGSDKEQPGRYIDPLQPDLLGEELISSALQRDSGLLSRVLEGGAPEECYSVIKLLVLLARRRPDLDHWLGVALNCRGELYEIFRNVEKELGDPVGWYWKRD